MNHIPLTTTASGMVHRPKPGQRALLWTSTEVTGKGSPVSVRYARLLQQILELQMATLLLPGESPPEDDARTKGSRAETGQQLLDDAA